ncbi:unnamed protein product [Prunus brigantina]
MSLSTRVLVLFLLATILALHPNSLLSLIRLAPESAFTRPSLHHTTKRSAVDDVSNKDDMKRKVEEKFNDLGDMCERGELEPEEAYKLLKVFEDEIVMR